ncbi:nmd3 [Symbiodinium sp. CCMP2592]|nr:nmd3 [Symbiodinium sp. CCMP2592]
MAFVIAVIYLLHMCGYLPRYDLEDEPEDDLEAGGVGFGLSGEDAAPTIENAVLQLTKIVSNLTQAKKGPDLESLLDQSGLGSSGDPSSLGTGKKSGAALRLLTKTFEDSPQVIAESVLNHMRKDLGGLAGVRWSWQVAGILDDLVENRVEKAKARAALLLGASDQSFIDGGSWIMSTVSLLETVPPYQEFSKHSMPQASESQTSALFDPRWSEVFLAVLRDRDSFNEARRKLASLEKGGRGRANQGEDGSADQPGGQRGPKGGGKDKGGNGSGGKLLFSLSRSLSIDEWLLIQADLVIRDLTLLGKFPVLVRDHNRLSNADLKKLVVNVQVILLNYLDLGRPRRAPVSCTSAQSPTAEQWEVIFRLECFLDAWFELGILSAEEMGRTAGKVEDLEKVLGFPDFDPRPFLDPITLEIFEHPMRQSLQPGEFEGSIPRVRVHCSREERLRLFKLLDQSRRIRLFPAEEVRAEFGSGVFAVLKSLELDRMILDSRPHNLLEVPPGRFIQSLGSGEVLTQLHLEDSERLYLSSNDIRDFYHLFRVNTERCRRNVLVGTITPKEAECLGCFQKYMYRHPELHVGLSCLAMGDTQAVELAQTCHLGLCVQKKIVSKNTLVSMSLPIPRGKVGCGIVIDDFVSYAIDSRGSAEVDSQPTSGALLADQAQEAYREVELIPHDDKSVRDSLRSEVWGALVDGDRGYIRGSLKRAAPLSRIILSVLQIGAVTAGLLEIIAGVIALFIYRRRLMSLLESVFSETRGREQDEAFMLNEKLREELILALGLIPTAVVELRAKYSDKVYAVDASNWGEAVCHCEVGAELSKELSRHSLRKGVWSRLLSPVKARERGHGILDPDLELPGGSEAQFRAHPIWVALNTAGRFKLSWSKAAKRRRHINIGELRSFLKAEKISKIPGFPTRSAVGGDSQVALGAVLKGRSASPSLNKELQGSIPHVIGGGLQNFYLYCPTSINTAVDPYTLSGLPSLSEIAKDVQAIVDDSMSDVLKIEDRVALTESVHKWCALHQGTVERTVREIGQNVRRGPYIRRGPSVTAADLYEGLLASDPVLGLAALEKKLKLRKAGTGARVEAEDLCRRRWGLKLAGYIQEESFRQLQLTMEAISKRQERCLETIPLYSITQVAPPPRPDPFWPQRRFRQWDNDWSESPAKWQRTGKGRGHGKGKNGKGGKANRDESKGDGKGLGGGKGKSDHALWTHTMHAVPSDVAAFPELGRKGGSTDRGTGRRYQITLTAALHVAGQQGLYFILEHPEDLGRVPSGERPASIWSFDGVRQICAGGEVSCWALHQCLFGAMSCKPTRLLSNLPGALNFGIQMPCFNDDGDYVGPLLRCPHTHADRACGFQDGTWKSAATAAYPSEFAAFIARLSLSVVPELRAVADSDLIPANIPSSAEAFATECITRGSFDRASVQILFDLLPKTRPHKITGSAEPGTAFFGGTVHQEGLTAPRSTCFTFPESMRVINAFLHSVDPHHRYAAFVLTKNVTSEVHRDPRNAAVPNLIVAISSFSDGGIWIQDDSGTQVRSFHGSPVTGTVHSLQDGPVYLDARGCLHDLPCLFKEDGDSQWASTSAELLASLAAMKVFDHLEKETAGVRDNIRTVVCGGTDNSSTGKLQKKGSSTKWPLMGIQMACAAALHKVNKQLTLQWRPRDENTLSDAITNHDFSSFCPELRVPLKLDDLPLDIFLRMVHSRSAFLDSRVSLQRLVSRESAMSRREKETSKTPWLQTARSSSTHRLKTMVFEYAFDCAMPQEFCLDCAMAPSSGGAVGAERKRMMDLAAMEAATSSTQLTLPVSYRKFRGVAPRNYVLKAMLEGEHASIEDFLERLNEDASAVVGSAVLVDELFRVREALVLLWTEQLTKRCDGDPPWVERLQAMGHFPSTTLWFADGDFGLAPAEAYRDASVQQQRGSREQVAAALPPSGGRPGAGADAELVTQPAAGEIEEDAELAGPPEVEATNHGDAALPWQPDKEPPSPASPCLLGNMFSKTGPFGAPSESKKMVARLPWLVGRLGTLLVGRPSKEEGISEEFKERAKQQLRRMQALGLDVFVSDSGEIFSQEDLKQLLGIK